MEWVGEISDRHKNEFLGNAYALVFPIDWPEPFGLVMIEAMACGTPIIAYDRGSVPEVMENGVTGFIVNDIEQAVEAVGRVRDLSRLGKDKSAELLQETLDEESEANELLNKLAEDIRGAYGAGVDVGFSVAVLSGGGR